MSGRRVTHAIAALTGLALLLAGAAGCTLVRAPRRAGQVLTSPQEPPSLLVLILGSTSAGVRAALSKTVAETARTGEQIVALSASGSTLGEFRAPSPQTISAPSAPIRPGDDATSFQLAQYAKSRANEHAAVAHDLHELQARQRQALQAWARAVVARTWSAAQRRDSGTRSLARSLSAAVADITTLEQAGGRFGARKVLTLISVPSPSAPPMQLDASLAGITVVLTGVPDGLSNAAWEATFSQAGASGVDPLPGLADSLLPGLIARGLEGRAGLLFTVTGLDYGPGQYAVPRRAVPSLRKLLHLLTITYPTGTAFINAYTDTVPVRGGNRLLSWRRAKAVLSWLVGHGIAAYRLQAIGHGSADPVAPNKPAGQPLNRRVVVIVSPPG